MAEYFSLLYVEAESPEQVKSASTVIGEHFGAAKDQRVIDDRYIVSDSVFGSSGEEAVYSALENVSSLKGVVDARAYICGDEDPWECFYRVIDGGIVAREHTPFEDDEIDLEEYKEGIYHWWHEGVIDGVKAGMLHGNISEPSSESAARNNYEETLDISKHKDSEDSYAYFEFTSEEADPAKIRNGIKKQIKVIFDSFHVSKTKSFRGDGRYGFLYLGYIWPKAVTEILTHNFFYDILTFLESAGAVDIVVKMSHKELEFDELIIAKENGSIKVFISASGELVEQKDLEFAAALSQRIRQHLPYIEYKARMKIPTEGLLSFAEKYCAANEIRVPGALKNRWEGEQYIFVDYKLRKLYAVATNDPRDIPGFLAKKNNEQKGSSSLGVINLFTKQVCIFDSELNFKCQDMDA
jgi:hypothetical protein